MLSKLSKCVDYIEQKLSSKTIPGRVALWEEEGAFLRAAARVRELVGSEGFEAISPYPVHGIESACGLKRSFIPYATFVFAFLGFGFGVWFTWWTSASDWPLVIGGKPMWSLPAFIPVIFECTILFAALGSVLTMLVVQALPKVAPPVLDESLSCHRFGIFVPHSAGVGTEQLDAIFKDCAAIDIKAAVF